MAGFDEFVTSRGGGAGAAARARKSRGGAGAAARAREGGGSFTFNESGGGGAGAAARARESSGGSSKSKPKKSFFRSVIDTVTGLPAGLARVGGGIASETFGGDNRQGLLDRFIRPAEGERRTVPLFDPAERRELREQAPITYEMFTSPARTARQVPDTLAAIRPGGPGFGQSDLGRQIAEEGYLSTGLAKVGDVATLAGGVGVLGKAAGAGRLARADRISQLAADHLKAAGVSKKAAAGMTAESAGKLGEAAVAAGDAAKGQRLLTASQHLKTVEDMVAQGAPTLAEKVTLGATKVATGGNRIAGGPAEVYTRAIPFALRKLGVTPAAAAAVTRLAQTDAGAELAAKAQRVGQRLHLDQASREFRSRYSREVDMPYTAEAHNIFKGTEEAVRHLPELHEQQAALLILSGDAQALAPLRALGDADQATVLRSLPEGVTPEAFRLATDFVTGQADPALATRMELGVAAFRDKVLTPSQERYLAGHGTRRDLSETGKAQRAEQTGREALSAPQAEVRAKYEQKRQGVLRAAQRRAEGSRIIPGESKRLAENRAAIKALRAEEAAGIERIKQLKSEQGAKQQPAPAAKTEPTKIRTVDERLAEKADAVETARLDREIAASNRRAGVSDVRETPPSKVNPSPAQAAAKAKIDLTKTQLETVRDLKKRLDAEGVRFLRKLRNDRALVDEMKSVLWDLREQLTENAADVKRFRKWLDDGFHYDDPWHLYERLRKAAEQGHVLRNRLETLRMDYGKKYGLARPGNVGPARVESRPAGQSERLTRGEIDEMAAPHRKATEEAARKRALSEVRSEAAKARWAKQKAAEALEASDAPIKPAADVAEQIKAEQKGVLSVRKQIREHEQRLSRIYDARLADKAALRRINAKEAAELDKVAQKVTSAPARYRNVLTHSRDAVKALGELRDQAEAAVPGSGAVFDRVAADIPTTLARLDEAGIDPTFLTGRKVTEASGRTSAGGARIPARRALASERQKSGEAMHTSLVDVARATTDELRQATRNEFSKHLGQDLGVKGTRVAKGKTGRELADAAKEQGLESFDPLTGGRVPDAKVDGDTIFLPKQLRQYGAKYLGPDGNFEKLLQSVYDRPTRAWKHTVLALSPRWHVGNILSNMVLLPLGAGVSPAEMVRHFNAARKLVKSGDHPFGGRDILATLEGAPTQPGRLGRQSKLGISGVIDTSYKMNEFVDNWGKSITYLSKTGKGLSPETAVKLALNAGGDFVAKSKFERQVIRRLFPFAAWQMHVTKLAFRLPVENPVRVAWVMRMADMGLDRSDEHELEGKIRVGEKYVSLRDFGPLGTAFGVKPNIGQAAFALNPMLKLGIAAATGRSANREFEPVYRPGTKFGDRPEALISKPGVLARVASQQVPQVRLAQDIAEALRSGGRIPTRYDTGQPTKKKRDITLAELLKKQAGVPVPEKPYKKKKR